MTSIFDSWFCTEEIEGYRITWRVGGPGVGWTILDSSGKELAICNSKIGGKAYIYEVLVPRYGRGDKQ